jgi:hypothetical protein
MTAVPIDSNVLLDVMTKDPRWFSWSASALCRPTDLRLYLPPVLSTSQILMLSQLVEVEQAFKELKDDLAIRPIYHQTDARIEAHIFVAFLAYCLQVTLKQRLRSLAPRLTPRSVLEKMAAIQMVDVYLPTTDGRAVILSRYTEPEADQAILLQRLKMSLPAQPPPRVTAADVARPL